MDQEKMEPGAIKWDSLAYGRRLAASLTAPALEQSAAYVPKPVRSAFWDMLLHEECIWCSLQIKGMTAALSHRMRQNPPANAALKALDSSKSTPTWDLLDYTISSNEMSVTLLFHLFSQIAGTMDKLYIYWIVNKHHNILGLMCASIDKEMKGFKYRYTFIAWQKYVLGSCVVNQTHGRKRGFTASAEIGHA